MTERDPHWTSPIATFGDVGHRNQLNHQLEEWSGFLSKLEAASFCMSVAFAENNVPFLPLKRTRLRMAPGCGKSWLAVKAADIQFRVEEVGHALTVQAKFPLLIHAPLARKAFMILAEDVPTSHQLLKILDSDPARAVEEIAYHVSHKGAIITQSACLLAQEEAARAAESGYANDVGKILDDLLKEAGGALTLTEASERMRMTKAAVHKRIKKGQALGVMRGHRLMLPTCQFVELSDGTYGIVHGLAEVLHLFAEGREGPVSTLQWLLAPHPNLDTTPIAALHDKNWDGVRRAAKAYLQLDDDA